MGILERIQRWYLDQCDEEWEHGQGISVKTLDNPGWLVEINLAGTPLHGRDFPSIENLRNESDWIYCSIEKGCFKGAGGAENLKEILEVFLSWAGY